MIETAVIYVWLYMVITAGCVFFSVMMLKYSLKAVKASIMLWKEIKGLRHET